MRVVDFVEIIPKIASIIATTKLYQIDYELVASQNELHRSLIV